MLGGPVMNVCSATISAAPGIVHRAGPRKTISHTWGHSAVSLVSIPKTTYTRDPKYHQNLLSELYLQDIFIFCFSNSLEQALDDSPKSCFYFDLYFDPFIFHMCDIGVAPTFKFHVSLALENSLFEFYHIFWNVSTTILHIDLKFNDNFYFEDL